jgi:hypothetical protein
VIAPISTIQTQYRPPLSPKDFRRSWQSHPEKLAGLTAYRTAFVDELEAVSFDALREQTRTIARRKMEAIYVDFSKTGLVTPQSISAYEAVELLEGVEAAVHHAAKVLGPVTQEVVAATNTVAPLVLAPLAEYLAELAPAQGDQRAARTTHAYRRSAPLNGRRQSRPMARCSCWDLSLNR